MKLEELFELLKEPFFKKYGQLLEYDDLGWHIYSETQGSIPRYRSENLLTMLQDIYDNLQKGML